MIFNNSNALKTSGSFIFSGNLCAKAHGCLSTEIIKEFWHNFTYTYSSLEIEESPELIFSVGKAEKLALDGSSYTINITPEGICVFAKSEEELKRGFMTLIDRFSATDDGENNAVLAECCEIKESAEIANRMVHFCIFPETELWELQRFVRFCAALKYTHVVLEFWGMLKYDCMKELAWGHAFKKEEVAPIIKEARELGLEIIPMFNHWGHASAGRVMHGKHVVLDQNPALQTYFSDDGWCWDIRKPKVKKLLAKIRQELIELCGEGSYFHIGCDEAYNFEFTEENLKFLSDYINEINAEMNSVGRRIFVWGDMFLYRYKHYNPKSKYTCNAPTPEVEKYFLEHLDKNIIIADWQYRAVEAPVETALVFKNAGFDCILCPWDEGKPQIDAAVETVKGESLFGFMHTTWHTLSSGTPYVVLMAIGGYSDTRTFNMVNTRPRTAALLRKVMPIGGDYEKSGWSRKQIYSKW